MNTAKDAWQMVRHPVETARGFGHAVTHPRQTYHALKEDIWSKLQTNAGRGELIGDLLLTIATGGSLKTTSKTGTLAKLADNAGANKLDDIPNFTFRGDTRSPSTIFNEGFKANGDSIDLFLHAIDNKNPPSAFIPTSMSFDVASDFADNVFIVRPRNGIDVNRVLGPRSPFPDELEIAVPYRILSGDVRAVTLPSQGISILNSNFQF